MSDNDFGNNQNENRDGLFSEDYEAPKRENPYLKKNREKAKAAKAPKPAKDKPDKRDKPDNPDKSGEEGFRHKRTFSDFIFEHIKPIAAILTIVAVLSLVLVTDVVDIVTNIVTKSEQAAKEEITLTYIEGLAHKSSPISWNDFSKFRYDVSDMSNSITWMLPVKGTSFEVWISGVDTSRAPTYIRIYDMTSGDHINLGEDDLAAFIEEHS